MGWFHGLRHYMTPVTLRSQSGRIGHCRSGRRLWLGDLIPYLETYPHSPLAAVQAVVG